jgi:hypothetical protein
VRVLLHFDADERELVDGLAELSGDGVECLECSGIEVTDAAADDLSAESFDPLRYGDQGVRA